MSEQRVIKVVRPVNGGIGTRTMLVKMMPHGCFGTLDGDSTLLSDYLRDGRLVQRVTDGLLIVDFGQVLSLDVEISRDMRVRVFLPGQVFMIQQPHWDVRTTNGHEYAVVREDVPQPFEVPLRVESRLEPGDLVRPRAGATVTREVRGGAPVLSDRTKARMRARLHKVCDLLGGEK